VVSSHSARPSMAKNGIMRTYHINKMVSFRPPKELSNIKQISN